MRSGAPLLISVSAVLFVAGLLICLWRIRDPRYSLPLLVLAGAILMGGLSIQAPNSQRLLYMAPALALMVVLPLEDARDWSARHWPGGRHALSVLAGLLVIVMLTQNLDLLFGRYFPREEYGSVHGEVTQEMIEIWPAFPPERRPTSSAASAWDSPRSPASPTCGPKRMPSTWTASTGFPVAQGPGRLRAPGTGSQPGRAAVPLPRGDRPAAI